MTQIRVSHEQLFAKIGRLTMEIEAYAKAYSELEEALGETSTVAGEALRKLEERGDEKSVEEVPALD